MNLIYSTSRYASDDTLAIMAWEADENGNILDEEDDIRVTVNVSEYYRFPLTDELVLLPKHSLSKEIYDTVTSDIVDKELCSYPLGRYGEAQMVRLKENWKDQVKMLP